MRVFGVALVFVGLIQGCSTSSSRSPSSIAEEGKTCFFRQVALSKLGLTEETFFDSRDSLGNRQIAEARPSLEAQLSCEEQARQHCERFSETQKGQTMRKVQVHYQPEQFQMAYRIDNRTHSEVKVYRSHPKGASLYCRL